MESGVFPRWIKLLFIVILITVIASTLELDKNSHKKTIEVHQQVDSHGCFILTKK